MGPSASAPPRRSGWASSAPILALVAALAIKEIPLRSTNEMPVAAAAPAEAPAKATKPEPVSANTVAGD